MAGKSRVGGNGGVVKRTAWVVIATAVTVWLFGGLFTSPGQVLPTMARASAQIESKVKALVAKAGLSTDGSAPSLPGATPTSDPQRS